MQTQIEEQLATASAIKSEGSAISDEAALQRQLNLLTLTIINIADGNNSTDNEIIVYQPDSTLSLDVRVENETVWLNRNQIITFWPRC